MFDPSVYDERFYAAEDVGRFASASVVLSALFKYYKPDSVVDFGCGLGHWLFICQQLGVEIIQGYDGHYVDTEKLKILQETFARHEFEEPVNTQRSYGLAISIEVGEHLPASKADTFVESIQGLVDFSCFLLVHYC